MISMIWYLLLGGLAGFLAGKVMRGQGYGVLVDILLGVIGGWIGTRLKYMLHLPFHVNYFFTAFLGAVLLVWIGRLLKRG